MRYGKRITGWAGALGMLMIILDGKTALTGAAEGIGLCLKTVIPSLFPFFVLSGLLLGNFDFKLLSPLCRRLGIPRGAEGILAAGFLGGYPAGAQCIGSGFSDKALSQQQASRLLTFCSNAGPSFLFGMVGTQFSRSSAAWALWAVQILSAVSVALLHPSVDSGPETKIRFSLTSLPDALRSAVRTMGLVCGWVVLFRILIAFLDRWVLWMAPDAIRVILCGILELSNGCCMLARIAPEGLRFVIASVLLSLGGLCVAMQTASVIQGLSIKSYLSGKLLQGIFSLVYSLFLACGGAVSLLCPALFLLFILHSRKNNSSIPDRIVV